MNEHYGTGTHFKYLIYERYDLLKKMQTLKGNDLETAEKELLTLEKEIKNYKFS